MKTWAILLTVLLTGFCQAELVYDHVIDSYQIVGGLHGNETLLMIDQGGCDSLSLWDSSYARIEGTSPLDLGGGGVWVLTMGGRSQAEILGGEIGTLSIGSYATAILSGGRIWEVYSGQAAWTTIGDPPALTWDPHITMICDVESVVYNEGTRRLTGNWLDGSAFNILLTNVDGYDPAIENIQFIPEPGTVFLLGLGGVMLWRRRQRA
jgi:hypothetical protein